MRHLLEIIENTKDSDIKKALLQTIDRAHWAIYGSSISDCAECRDMWEKLKEE